MKSFTKSIRNEVEDLFFCILGSAFYSAGIAIFASGANFAPGGISGLSIIIHHFFTVLPIGTLTVLLNIPVILICYKNLGKDYLLRSLFVMGMNALFLDVIWPLFPSYHGETLLAAIFAGVLCGVGLSFIYTHGSCCAGTDFIIMSLKKKYPYRSVGSYTALVDGGIIVLGALAFSSINSILYGLVMTGAETMMMDSLMQGARKSKQLTAITDRGEEMAVAIREKAKRGVTMIDVIGTYSMKEHKMLICNCSPSEVFLIRDICFSIDPDAFLSVTTNDAVYGKGFKSKDENLS